MFAEDGSRNHLHLPIYKYVEPWGVYSMERQEKLPGIRCAISALKKNIEVDKLRVLIASDSVDRIFEQWYLINVEDYNKTAKFVEVDFNLAFIFIEGDTKKTVIIKGSKITEDAASKLGRIFTFFWSLTHK